MDVFPRAELYRLVSRVSYPGVDANEHRSIRQWIRREGIKYEELRFNVRVGAGVKLEGGSADKFNRYWEQITRMRLDLLAWNPPNEATIVEAKVAWTNDAVWQLLSYRDAYRVEFPEHNISLVGVCEAYSPNARQLASDQGIRLHVYTFADPLPQADASSVDEP